MPTLVSASGVTRLKVIVCPGDDSGCGWYRMRFPALAAAAQGFDVEIRNSLGKVLHHQGRYIKLQNKPDYDVVVFQRPFHVQVAAAIPLLHRYGVACVVEMDDDASCLPPGHAQFMPLHPKWSPDENYHNAEMAAQMADLVIVSTPRLLKRYAPHGRGVVLRNCIPEEYLSVVAEAQLRPLVGWTGALVVHAGDVEVTRMGVANGLPSGWAFAAAETGLPDFAHEDEAHRRFGIPPDRRVVFPWRPLRDGYARSVAALDVGLAPLALNHFNQCKSALRGLEYAAMGVPFVASPTEEYELLAGLGVGRLAAKPRDWTRHLRELCGSVELRADEAGRGKEIAAELTYERQAEHWIDAWTLARENADAAMVAAR